MKKLTFAIAAIAVFFTVSAANANAPQQIWAFGTYCKAMKSSVVCTPQDNTGYTVGMSKRFFIVMHNDKTILTRENR